MVACPSGKTMSDADVLFVRNYLTNKWKIGNTPNTEITRAAAQN
jgi:hypothetical protein